MSQTVEVPLTHGQCAIIDAADAEIVAGYRWKFLPSAALVEGDIPRLPQAVARHENRAAVSDARRGPQ